MNSFVLFGLEKRRSIGKIVIWLLLVGLALSGCRVDRSGLLSEAEQGTVFEVVPPNICPEECVTVSWMVPDWEGCPGRFTPCSSINRITSSPVNLFIPPVRSDETEGSRVVCPADDTLFRLEATVCDERGCLDDPVIKNQWVNVLQEEEGAINAVFRGVCDGAVAGHAPFFLSLSHCSRITEICNTGRDPITLHAGILNPTAPDTVLYARTCTENFNHLAKPGEWLWAEPLFPLDPMAYCGALETSGPPGSLEVTIYIECVPDREGCGGTTSEAIISVVCGDGICNAEYEDTYNCPDDCGLPVVPESVTPIPTEAPPSPPATPTGLVIAARVCSGTTYSVTLGWVDNAANETGYRVFRNGQTIATLGANTTGYTDNPPGSGPYTYGVQAFNAVGNSATPTVEEEGCIF